MNRTVFSLAAALLLAAGASAFAKHEKPISIPFAGGKLTITETPNLEKILAFNGKELARNYVVLYNRTVDLQGTKVALFAVGNGGNACGPATVIVWKPQDGDLKTTTVGEECGAPPAAIADDNIYFVPYLRPGATADVQSWSPQDGLRVAGQLTYVPQPDTHWADLDPAKAAHPFDLFANSDFYAAARKVLGDKFSDVVLALSVSSGLESTASGVFYGSGCIPHACGEGNGFVAVDTKDRAVYFAQENGGANPDAWPPLDSWPEEVRAAMTKSFNE
jgi:hypothetical protein